MRRAQRMMIRGIVFDMDGTITEPYLDFDSIRAAVNVGDVDLVEYLDRAVGEEKERVRSLLARFEQEGAAKARLNRGARRLLAHLRRRGLPVALLTRNTRRSVDAVCRRLGLTFDATISREDAPHKPSPEPVREIARRWKMAPAELLVVGDYKWDLMCARNAGAPCAVLVNGAGTPEWAREADFILRRLTDLIGILEPLTAAPAAAGAERG
jgi:HAD superfamily hydrolase (TIGR01549 family)